MPKINFIFIPHHNSGGNFVIWSMYYLSNQPYYYAQGEKHLVCDTKNILNPKIKNAHTQLTMTAVGFDECVNLPFKVQDVDISVINVYVRTFNVEEVAKKIFNQSFVDLPPLQRLECFQHIEHDTQLLINFLQKNYKITMLHYHQLDYLNRIYNDRNPVTLNNESLGSVNNKLKWFQEQFYSTASDQWDCNIWDQREHLALIVDPDLPPFYNHMIDLTQPHLIYTTDDIWNNLPDVIEEILEFNDLNLDSTKIESWKQTYHIWREYHDCYFSRCFDQIIEAIVNNHFMSLRRFHLDFGKEVLIQSALIHRHKLNLKTWQLEKFPSNTQDLHKLLEPCIHTI